MTPNFCLALSPASPSALLLYGIVFFFASAKYLGVPWQRGYTIAMYLALAAWAAIAMYSRLRRLRFNAGRMDLLFSILIGSILVSAGLNWWGGTVARLQMMPFFVLLPYLLGRFMTVKDCHELRDILVVMGALLLLLIVPEYVHTARYGYVFVNSPTPVLFGQGHGVMLTGLLLSSAFMALISIVLWPGDSGRLSFLSSRAGKYVAYALLAAFIVTLGWVSSRGPLLTGIVGTVTLFLLAPRVSRRRRAELLIVAVLATGIAIAHSMQRVSNAAYYAAIFQSPVSVSREKPLVVDSTPAISGRASSILGQDACKQINDSITDRWVHYQQAVRLFANRPIFGAGANQYGFYSCQGPDAFPHSTILQIFAELGLFVGLIYGGMLVLTLHTIFRQIRNPADPESRGIWSWVLSYALVQFLLAQLIGDYFLSTPSYFVMGIAAGIASRSPNTVVTER